jgi:hypothetical protein
MSEIFDRNTITSDNTASNVSGRDHFMDICLNGFFPPTQMTPAVELLSFDALSISALFSNTF